MLFKFKRSILSLNLNLFMLFFCRFYTFRFMSQRSLKVELWLSPLHVHVDRPDLVSLKQLPGAVQYLAQGYFKEQLGEPRNRTSNLPITGQPALPPEQQISATLSKQMRIAFLTGSMSARSKVLKNRESLKSVTPLRSRWIVLNLTAPSPLTHGTT